MSNIKKYTAHQRKALRILDSLGYNLKLSTPQKPYELVAGRSGSFSYNRFDKAILNVRLVYYEPPVFYFSVYFDFSHVTESFYFSWSYKIGNEDVVSFSLVYRNTSDLVQVIAKISEDFARLGVSFVDDFYVNKRINF